MGRGNTNGIGVAVPRRLMTLMRDVRLAIRGLGKTPGFTAVAVLTLALGIGANTTIFSVVQAVLLQPLPYPEADRIVQIYETHVDRGWDSMSFSHPNFWDLWDQNDSFETIAAMTGSAMNLTGFDYPEQISARSVSAEFFRVFRIEPRYGRLFLPGEDQPDGDSRIALLGSGFWTRRFGSDPGIVGRTITLDGEVFTVVGVLPDGSPFPGDTDVYVPTVRGTNMSRNDHRLFVVGRLAPGVTVEAAAADLGAVTAGIGLEDADGALGVRIVSSSEWVASPQLRVALWVLMGAVGFLLLIACANLTNLLLARATGRRRESAICAALGATRGRVISQILTESVTLALVGGAAGVGLSMLGLRLLQAYGPGGIPRLADVGLNPWVLGFTLIASLGTGVVIGLIPGLQLPYGNLLTMLREGDRGVAGSRGQNRTRSALVAIEAALSLMLLIGAALMIRSFGELQRVGTGFDSENRLSFQISLPASYGVDGTEQFFDQFLSRVDQMSPVTAIGAVNVQPISGGSVGMGIAREELMHDESAVTWVDWRLVTPNYFRAMGLSLARGRNYTNRDRIGEPWQVVISQQLADRLWPDEDPIGRRAALWVDSERIADVIGVVSDMRERGPEADPTMVVYLPYRGAAWTPATFVVHTVADSIGVVPTLRGVLGEIDPNLPISGIAPLDELVNDSVAGNQFNASLLVVFSGVALLLALAGIYGVLAYSVTRRTSEIGLRVALGASAQDVMRQVVMRGMRPVLAGIAIGLVGALALSRFLSALLFEIAPTDPATYAGVASLLTVAALLACYVPARRALRIDPVAALRQE